MDRGSFMSSAERLREDHLNNKESVVSKILKLLNYFQIGAFEFY